MDVQRNQLPQHLEMRWNRETTRWDVLANGVAIGTVKDCGDHFCAARTDTPLWGYNDWQSALRGVIDEHYRAAPAQRREQEGEGT
jgi:hypothetical protein